LTSNDLGSVVVVGGVKEDTECHVIVDTDDPEDLNAYAYYKIEGSCDGSDCLYSVLFIGYDCLVAPDLDGYVGSTMAEFQALPRGMRDRLVRQRGTCICKDPEGKEIDCTCTAKPGDANALDDTPWYIGHKWSGRPDLNFVKAKDGNLQKRHEEKKKSTGEVSYESR
jgi:hypothetical protein